MVGRLALLALLAHLAYAPPAAAQDLPYVPGPGEAWERRAPAEVGMDPEAVETAVRFAVENESAWGRDTSMRVALEQRLAEESHGRILGPLRDRGGPAGLILRGGYIVAEWGDGERVDMAFSVTKSFLSTVAGVAWDRGLIDTEEPVRRFVEGSPEVAGLFTSARNRRITWHHLLTQTSEWEGSLWGKPDAADRRRGADRELREPGTFWEYNDIRVNLTALALLHVFGRPLPAVLEEHVMDPIDASDTWRWHGYENSWSLVGGRRLPSVSGGGHWGGGLWISSRDLARFGLLFLREGAWGDRTVLSSRWVRRVTTHSEVHPVYGYMWWLNTEGAMWPEVPESSYAALGAGTNAVWVSPEHDVVVVVRWIERDALGPFLGRVADAVRGPLAPGAEGAGGPGPEGAAAARSTGAWGSAVAAP